MTKTTSQKSYSNSQLLHVTLQLILDGSHDDIKDVSHMFGDHWKYYDNLTVEDGIILHDEVLLILPLERREILISCHKGQHNASFMCAIGYTGLA